MKISNLYFSPSSPNKYNHQGDEYIKTKSRDLISNSSDHFIFFPYQRDLFLEYADFVYESGSGNCIPSVTKSYFNHKNMTLCYTTDADETFTENWQISNLKLINSANVVHLDFSEISENLNKEVEIYSSKSENIQTNIVQYSIPQTCPNAENFPNMKCIKTVETNKWHSGESCKTTRFYGRNFGLMHEEKRHYFENNKLAVVQSRTLEQIL